MTTESKKTHIYPKSYYTIDYLFILLILYVGWILTWQNYKTTKKIVLSDADRFYDQVASKASLNLKIIHNYLQ